MGKTILGANVAEWEEDANVGTDVALLGSQGKAQKMRKTIVPSSLSQKNRSAEWMVDETPQPQVQTRVTRGSAAKEKGKRKGVEKVVNPEFEFSDDE